MKTKNIEKLEIFLKNKNARPELQKAVQEKLKTIKESNAVNKSIDAVVVNSLKDRITSKKSAFKDCDGIVVNMPAAVKTTSKAETNKNELKVTAIINTTNLMDSHDDVHIKGIWNNGLKTFTNIYHVQEHQLSFDKIIADAEDLKVYVKEYTWKELGYGFEGTTEALVFESTVKADRNPFMFKQYRDGHVKNHSVRMRYVDVELAVNDEDYKEEFSVWNKYINEIANKEYAESKGYFFAVKEAIAIEGSAVLIGSNQATPTLSVKNEDVVEVKIDVENVDNTIKEDLLEIDTEAESVIENEKLQLELEMELEIFCIENQI